MTIAAHTLGCKLNFAETSALLRRLENDGHRIVGFDQAADFYIVNTCTVTAVAEKKCRNAIRQAVALNPEAQVAVIGCFAQVAEAEISRIPGVTLILGNDRKHLLPDFVAAFRQSKAFPQQDTSAREDASSRESRPLWDFEPQYSGDDRTRTFFKIQDGCDYFCTYCAIPFARGRSRSASVADTLAVARRIAASGAKEVVLTGVNTGTFGQQHGETLLDLLRALDQVEGIERFRISSIEPNLLTDAMVDFIASSRAFLPHFHIPLQAGSDRVLALMHRRYDTRLYRDKLLYIKSLMPDACIAADVMAGFNGESEAEFEGVLDYIGSLPISYLHVFTYSERPGTAAQRLPERVPMHERRQHTARLLELSERKHRAFVDSQMGRVRPVLWESTCHDGQMQGWTDNYIRLARPFDAARVGVVEPVCVTPDNLVAASL